MASGGPGSVHLQAVVAEDASPGRSFLRRGSERATLTAESPSLVLDNWWNPSTNLYAKYV